jgi:Domain of unknown function (DUF4157)
MNCRSITQKTTSSFSFTPIQTGLLQRKCNSCGQHTIAGGECTNCQPKSGLQRKLTIGASNDPLELEADRITDRVMRMPEPSIQRQMEPEEDEEEGMVQRKAIANQVSPLDQNQASSEVPPSVNEGLRSPGQPLDPATCAFMEPRFGQDFSQVRVHTDVESAESARAVDALAYTVKRDVVFGAGQYAPETSEGRKLLAHELTHVVQQEGQTKALTNKLSPSETNGLYEREADEIAKAVVLEQGAPRFASLGSEMSTQTMPHRSSLAVTPDMGSELRRQPSGSQPTSDIPRQQEASRAEAQEELTTFLRRSLQTQGGRSLQVTKEVRSAVISLFIDDPFRLSTIEGWLNQLVLPGDPAEFSMQVVRQLPEKIDRVRLENLKQLPTNKPTPSRLGRLRELVERTDPGKRDFPEPTPEPTSQERFEQGVKNLRQQRGEPKATQYGPYSVDLLRAARIAGGLPEAWRGPRQQSQARGVYPEVEKAIQQLVAPNALVPAEVTWRREQAETRFEFAGPEEEKLHRLGQRDARAMESSFADAHEVARELAWLLDIAHQQGDTEIDLRLSGIYNSVPNRDTIYSEIRRIALIVRKHLSHHAPKVSRLNVFIGNNPRIKHVVVLSTTSE